MPAMFPQNGTGAAMIQCVIASAFAIIPTFIAAYVFYKDDQVQLLFEKMQQMLVKKE